MPEILHIQPHPGGGAENVVEMLESMGGFTHSRAYVASRREPLPALPSIAAGWPKLAVAARHADALHIVGDVSAMLCLPLMRARPAVVSTQGLHFLRRARGVRAGIARSGMRAVTATAARTVCASRAEVDEVSAVAGTEGRHRLALVHNGIPVPPPPSADERDAARAALGIEPDRAVALYLGQLETRKDPLTPVRAVEGLVSQGASIVLLVAGEGPMEEEIRARGNSAVKALGFRRDVPRLLAASDILVMPSAREGLSLAVLEAMSQGLVPVVSDGAGNPEAVGDAGVVYPFGDAQALADALSRLVEAPEERESLGAAARRRVEERFTAERYVSSMREQFEAVLAEAGRTREPGPTAAAPPA
jgi:glycosyltransferase involved in cell wall biosynthesis